MLARKEPHTAEVIDWLTKLPDADYQQVLCATAAQRRAPQTRLDREAELLALISTGLATDTWEAYHELGARKTPGELRDADDARITEVVSKIETFAADRARWIGELAGLQGKSVAEVMRDLDLTRG
jgi:hypothetical protein